MLLISGNPFKCHEEVSSLQPMIPPKHFDIFPDDWGMLRRSRCVHMFKYVFENTVLKTTSNKHYTIDTMSPPSGNPFKCHEEVWSLQPTIPPKHFDTFPPDWGMLRRSRYVQIFI